MNKIIVISLPNELVILHTTRRSRPYQLETYYLTLFLMGFLTNRNLWGGKSGPPSYMAIRGYFQCSVLTGVLSWM